MNSAVIGMAGSMAVLLVACSQNPVAPGPTPSPSTAIAHMNFVYVCCNSGDVAVAWHPGENVSLHWIAQAAPSPSNAVVASARTSPIPLVFQAGLYGPYPSVGQAQADGPKASQVLLKSSSYSTNDWAGRSFSVSFTLSPDFQPGFYDLRTIEAAPGQSNVADMVISVAR